MTDTEKAVVFGNFGNRHK